MDNQPHQGSGEVETFNTDRRVSQESQELDISDKKNGMSTTAQGSHTANSGIQDSTGTGAASPPETSSISCADKDIYPPPNGTDGDYHEQNDTKSAPVLKKLIKKEFARLYRRVDATDESNKKEIAKLNQRIDATDERVDGLSKSHITFIRTG